jgi:hypothetical protein
MAITPRMGSIRIGFDFIPGRDADNPPPSEQGPARPEPMDVTVPNSTSQPHVVLTGFMAEFNNDRRLPNAGDHHFGQLEIRLTADRTSPTNVRVTARVGLRDWSHVWDDPFRGELRFIVIT